MPLSIVVPKPDMADENLNDLTTVRFRSGSHDEDAVFQPNGIQSYRSDDDISTDDDEDDEVDTFSEDPNLDSSSKPLMHPRQRPKVKVHGSGRAWQRIAWPCVYLFIFSASLAAFVCLIVYIVNTYTNRLLLEELRQKQKQMQQEQNLTLVGCDQVKVSDVWVTGIPKILTESAFRMYDINKDGILDVILGYATGGDKLREEPLVCEIYFNGTHPCGGGILALDGSTGLQLWRYNSVHEIFSLNCGADLDRDGINDCIGGGRAGQFSAVSGRRGAQLWTFNDSSLNDIMNLYTGQFIKDLDGDGVQDILNIHGGDPLGEPGSETRLAGKLIFFSGRTGKVLAWSAVPDNRESYYSPVIYEWLDGTQIVLFGTGGETHPGSLWYITLTDLYQGHISKAQRIYTDNNKGIMTPPVLIDLTLDGVTDIVFSTFNSSVVALDGATYETLWNYTFPLSETYATPAPGYYNDDAVPDFMVRWQHGPGFPIYYHSTTTVLDGRNGQPLLTPYPRDSIGAQTSPLTVSMEGQGNDMFLYWIADCEGHESQGGEFAFKEGYNVHEQTRSDLCRLRFKSEGFSRMYALSKHTEPPGAKLYDSVERKEVEKCAWVNTTAESMQFMMEHPEHLARYLQYERWIQYQLQQAEAERPALESQSEDYDDQDYQPETMGLDYGTGSTTRPSYPRQNSDYFDSRNPYGYYGKKDYDESRDGEPAQSYVQKGGYPENDNLNPYNGKDYSLNGRNRINGGYTSNNEYDSYNQNPLNTMFDLNNQNPLKNRYRSNNQGMLNSRYGDNNRYNLRTRYGENNGYIARPETGSVNKYEPKTRYDSNAEYRENRNQYKPNNAYGLNGRYDTNEDYRTNNRYGQDNRYDSYGRNGNNDLNIGRNAMDYNSNSDRFYEKDADPDDYYEKLYRDELPSLRKYFTQPEKTNSIYDQLSDYMKEISNRKDIDSAPSEDYGDVAAINYDRYNANSSGRRPLQDGKILQNTGMPSQPNILRNTGRKVVNHILKDRFTANRDGFGNVNTGNTQKEESKLSGHDEEKSHVPGVPYASHMRNKAVLDSVLNKNPTLGVTKSLNIPSTKAPRVSNKEEGTEYIQDYTNGQPKKRTVFERARKTFEKVKHSKRKKMIKQNRRPGEGLEILNKRFVFDRFKSFHEKPLQKVKPLRRKRSLKLRASKPFRLKRHVGPHDEGGIQRLISTGTLAPTSLPPEHPDYDHSIDVIFATYWFYPAKTETILPEDQKCVDEKMAKEIIRFDPNSKYFGMDHDAFGHEVIEECVEQSGHQLPDEGIYESQKTSNVYNLHMGQMTIYRLRVTCNCGDETDLKAKGQKCAKTLPFSKQQWPAYMGTHADSHWKPRFN